MKLEANESRRYRDIGDAIVLVIDENLPNLAAGKILFLFGITEENVFLNGVFRACKPLAFHDGFRSRNGSAKRNFTQYFTLRNGRVICKRNDSMP